MYGTVYLISLSECHSKAWSLCKENGVVVYVVARKDTPSCSQHVSFSPFLVDPPKLKNVYLRRDRLDRTDDFDVFELFGQHTRKESTDWSSPHTSLVCSVPSAKLLQLCRMESPFNRTNREDEDGHLTETQRENKPQNTERRISRKASLPRKRSRSKCIPEEGSEAEPEERNKREERNTVWPTGELLKSGPTEEERLFHFQELITWEYSAPGTSVRTLRWRHLQLPGSACLREQRACNTGSGITVKLLYVVLRLRSHASLNRHRSPCQYRL